MKYQWMGITAVALSSVLLVNPMISLAEGADEGLVWLNEDGEYEVDEDGIYALIDMEELRSSIDVDLLRDSIDVDSLYTEAVINELKSQISISDLEASISYDDLSDEYKAIKDTSEFDSILQDVIDHRLSDPDSSGYSDAKAKIDYYYELKEEYSWVNDHPADSVNVTLPVIGKPNPFNYIVDPYELVYETDAAKYGGGKVQKGAHILFTNQNGVYRFSDTSDGLTVVNKSNVPVTLTVRLKVTDSDEVVLVDSTSKFKGTESSMYVALADSSGVMSVASNDAEAVIKVTLAPAPDDAFRYIYDEGTDEYRCELKEGYNTERFDSFTFKLKADCNPDADWFDMDTLPGFAVSWEYDADTNDWDTINAALDEIKNFEMGALKEYKVSKLYDEKLEELKAEKRDELINTELEILIDKKLNELADKEYDKLKEKLIEEYKEKLEREKEEVEEAEEAEIPDELLDEDLENEESEELETEDDLSEDETSEDEISHEDAQNPEDEIPDIDEGSPAPESTSTGNETVDGIDGGEPDNNVTEPTEGDGEGDEGTSPSSDGGDDQG